MIETPLHSSLWYRVAGLRPRLQARARLHRHQYRGEVWYLLQDPASARVHRFTPAARFVIAAMDGSRSVEQIWQQAREELGDAAPTQDELIQLLGQLHAADLLRSDVPPDTLELFERGQRESSAKSRRKWTNPLAIRIPLWDPGPFLDRHAALWRTLWSRAGALVWLALVLPAVLLLPSQWDALTHNVGDRVLAPDNLLLVGLLFPLIKALHELGHATATRAGGGEVHDMGLMLLVGMPVPYVDASAANVLRSRWQRATVGAAGMLVELALAALAFYAWMLLEPGLVRAACFNVMLVAGVSTLVFNGNPLLRYDAYYMLADMVELPNLGQQSARQWGYWIKRHLLRMPDEIEPATTRAEAWWYGVYGLASTAYRMVVALAIALFIGTRFFFFGVALAIWALVSMALLPLWRAWRALQAVPATRERPLAVHGRLAAWVGAALLVFIALPMPYRTQAEGIVWLPEQAIVRAGADGFFDGFDSAPGQAVNAGAALLQLRDARLDAQLQLLEARVAELEASFSAEFVQDRAKAEIVREQLKHEQLALARAQERAAALQVRAGSAGQFTVPQPQDLPGRWLRRGEVVGYLMGGVAPVVRVVLDQASVDSVALDTREVQLRLAGALERTLEGRILRQVPAGRESLPSAALSAVGGGQFAADPRDPEGRRMLERVFELDVGFDNAAAGGVSTVGQRVHLRFAHPPAPLAWQAWRGVRRLFLRHFDV